MNPTKEEINFMLMYANLKSLVEATEHHDKVIYMDDEISTAKRALRSVEADYLQLINKK